MSESRRYVVLHHEEVAKPHFDVMFETFPGGPLATWRSPVWPIRGRVSLERLGAHRRDYLEYEGPVSGNRGVVKRVESGWCTVEQASEGVWVVRLSERGVTLRLEKDQTHELKWMGCASA